ncbi:MAG TPA: alpha/beta fold hydrolase [Anaerolineales bacterium]|nr:alpha/beta fold hydrolase [Anaerolineales bacterium]
MQNSAMSVLTAGTALDSAEYAIVAIHGRGGTAQSMLALAQEVAPPEFALLAPQAEGFTWYPFSFLAPQAQNQPALGDALQAVAHLLETIQAAGISPARTVLFGFSQGACLALESVARRPQRFGGVLALSGALIGLSQPPYPFAGDLLGTPIFLGCSDVDAHIPLARLQASAQILRQMNASVTERIYPNMAHTINHDEVKWAREFLKQFPSKSNID